PADGARACAQGNRARLRAAVQQSRRRARRAAARGPRLVGRSCPRRAHAQFPPGARALRIACGACAGPDSARPSEGAWMTTRKGRLMLGALGVAALTLIVIELALGAASFGQPRPA